ncbi:MAG TPA: ABC transporter ATP-binding protein [Candidatus Binatia bacterium]|nr:ABC transporter ATP-binding protein [Candidatus Binatia bacterium]
MLLAITDLHVSYGAVHALQGVSLSVNAGEIVTLIGSNGAGKSTLLRCVSGLVPAAAGEIVFDKTVRLNRLAAHTIVREGISHVPEGRQIFANLSVRENLLLGAYRHHDREEIRETMERAFTLFPVLRERQQQSASTLSGGEQQMLAIGRALMARPQLLLLDEPSLGLAPLVVQKIFAIIQEINAQGTTILLVEQNAHMALRVAQRGYVLQAGCVVLEGAGTDLLKSPEVRAAYLGE